jgi:hypothetical protein
MEPFLDTVLNLRFLITFGLVMAAFLPLALSVLFTYLNNSGEKTE